MGPRRIRARGGVRRAEGQSLVQEKGPSTRPTPGDFGSLHPHIPFVSGAGGVVTLIHPGTAAGAGPHPPFQRAHAGFGCPNLLRRMAGPLRDKPAFFFRAVSPGRQRTPIPPHAEDGRRHPSWDGTPINMGAVSRGWITIFYGSTNATAKAAYSRTGRWIGESQQSVF
jgi:hypothetical protein